MKELAEIVNAIGEVAHWTVRPAGDDATASMCPPIITLRYQRPSSEMADFFQRSIGSFAGTIPWEFSAAERVWTLMPSRIREFSESHGNLGGFAVVEELMELDPDFGRRANAELPLLIAHLRRHLGNIRATSGESIEAGALEV